MLYLTCFLSSQDLTPMHVSTDYSTWPVLLKSLGDLYEPCFQEQTSRFLSLHSLPLKCNLVFGFTVYGYKRMCSWFSKEALVISPAFFLQWFLGVLILCWTKARDYEFFQFPGLPAWPSSILSFRKPG